MKVIDLSVNKNFWLNIQKEYDISKRNFGKRINFIDDKFTRKIIFRDIGQAYFLAKNGFSKSAVILAIGVIEELLRQYLNHKNISPKNNKFIEYIRICENKGLLKSAVSKLSHSVREFGNLVHLAEEKNKKHTI